MTPQGCRDTLRGVAAPTVRIGTWLAVVVAAWSLCAAPAGASTTFALHGQLQQRYLRLSEFALDEDGGGHGQPFRDTLRLRVESQMNFTRTFWLRTNLQLLDGQILGPEAATLGGRAGRRWRTLDVLDHFFLRESVIQVPIGIGAVRAGRMPVHWGLGLVVNDGQQYADAWFADPAGGDIVNGVVVDVQPLLPFTQGRLGQAVHLGLGVDLVERDELADREGGDLAWRFSGSLTWEEPSLWAGVLFVMRDVERAGHDHATHVVFDAAADWRARFGPDLGLRLAGEVALVTGSTRTSPPAGARTDADVRQIGGALRAAVEDLPRSLEYELETGFASGDSEPFDGRDTGFRFDPAYRAGMILFEEVLARTSARAWDDVVASSAGAWPTQRPDLLPTDTAIANAAYLAPRVRLTLCEGCFRVEAGGLLAFAPSPVVDPASAAAAGEDEAPRNPWGAPARSGLLGYELHAGARFAFDVAELVRLSIGTQYGVFVPGVALEGTADAPGPGTIHKWRLLADVAW